MAETVIITGRDLDVEHQADDERANPKRKRPPEYIAPPPSEIDLGELIDLLQITNPYWDAYANEYAEINPDRLHGKALAKLLRKHRIDPTKEAA